MTPIEIPPSIHSPGAGKGNKGTGTTSFPLKKSERQVIEFQEISVPTANPRESDVWYYVHAILAPSRQFLPQAANQ
jgi:hypothetical protein